MSARPGLAQHQRLAAALAPHYFDVDELALPQLLALVLAYAGMVRLEHAGAGVAAPPGTWQPYFGADETMVMAAILSVRAGALRAEFALESGAAMLGRWYTQLCGWSAVLHAAGSAGARDLAVLVDGLAVQLAQPGEGAGGPQAAGPDSEAQAQLRSHAHFNHLMKAVTMIQHAAARRLPASLETGRHDPGIGLLLAFVQLYRAAQDKLNRFAERHLDFYYDRVLHVRAQGALRDATFLVFPPALPGATVRVPAGTAFLAPWHARQPELLFDTEHDVTVTDAALVACHTLYLERSIFTVPENRLGERRHGRLHQYPTAARVTTLPVLAPAAAVNTARLTPHPLFGAPRHGTPLAGGQRARIGFALASDVLLMQEGERSVHVVLQLGAERAPAADQDGTEPRRTRAGATLGQRLDRLRALLDCSDGELDDKVLRRLFNISITGAAGWIDVAEYSVRFVADPRPDGEGDALHLYIALPAAVPAVVAYQGALHGGAYRTACPLLRCELNDQGYLYPYGLLRGLPLVQARIDVTVKGLHALVVQNNIGPLSATVPFQPFGPLPARGDYLIVGSAEAACKHLVDAELVLAWGGVPSTPGGLRHYYGAYGPMRDQAPRATPVAGDGYRDMQVALSALVDGKWLPGATVQSRQPVLAPAPDAADAPVPAVATLALNAVLPLLRVQPRASAARPFAYTPGAHGGFFRLTLAGSDFAFGHRTYPLVLAAALTHNSQPGHRRRLMALPNPPYTPLLESLALNYRATASIVPRAARATGSVLLRLHPQGWDQAGPGGERGDLLLPALDFAGNLYLGLAATDLAAPLTLYFHLVEDALPMTRPQGRSLQWSYLRDNQWQPLPAHAIRADSTRAFLRPGIVTINLPRDIRDDNTVMAPGCYWLRVACDRQLEKFCSLYSVHVHAAQVWCRAADSVDSAVHPAAGAPPAVVGAGAITRAQFAVAGLGKPTQMLASFGGRLAESRTDLRRRVSERLKHKDRAVTPDDYERLVLERFHEIDRVKCFPNLAPGWAQRGQPSPGHVLVVGLPPYRSRGQLGVLPRLNGDLIAQVHAFLAARVAPAVKLAVVNPVYQRIQVRCTVLLEPDADAGWVVNTLGNLVSDFISPWSEGGNTSHFGWRIRQHDIEALMLAQPGVRSVTAFSLLSVSAESQDRYELTDTAPPPGAVQAAAQVRPASPWSIAVPFRRHEILVADSAPSSGAAAVRTGIGRLEIGTTFIISPSAGAAADDQT
jgi:hypothetical protein